MAKAKTKQTSFSFTSPSAANVQLVGDFTHWQASPVELKKQKKDGLWKAAVPLAPGSYRYRFLVDGQWHDDPASSMRVANPYGGEDSVIVVE